jgi:hypothetical protein
MILHGNFRRTRSALGALGDSIVPESFGATVWDWLHPEQVAAEYEMQGKTAPADTSLADVTDAAKRDAADLAAQAKAELTSGATKLAVAAGVGVALVALIWLSGRR